MPRLIAAVFLLLLPTVAIAQDRLPTPATGWKIPDHAPRLTPWAKEVTPRNALPEYPRPQMVRQRWQNLNGLWHYAVTPKADEKPPARYDGTFCLVPIQSVLSGVMQPRAELKGSGIAGRFPSQPRGAAGGLCCTSVRWTGRPRSSSTAGTSAAIAAASILSRSTSPSALKKEASRKSSCRVWDPTDAGWQLRGKQTLHPGGAAYTACSGIWQTVWLEPVPPSSIESLHLVPDLASGTLKLTVDARTPVGTTGVRVTVSEGGKTVSSATGTLGSELTEGVRENLAWYKARLIWVTTDMTVPMKDAELWTPDSPVLYDVAVQLMGDDGSVLDTVTSYAGMRSIAVGKDEQGVPRPMLNGKPIMLPGRWTKATGPTASTPRRPMRRCGSTSRRPSGSAWSRSASTSRSSRSDITTGPTGSAC